MRVCPRHPPCKPPCHRLTDTKHAEDGYILCYDLFYGTGLRISGSDSCIESHISICTKFTSADALQFQTALAYLCTRDLPECLWVDCSGFQRGDTDGTLTQQRASTPWRNCWEISALVDHIFRHLMQINTNNSNSLFYILEQ